MHIGRMAKAPEISQGPVLCLEIGAGRGTRTHTPAKVADFKSSQASSTGTEVTLSNSELISSFVNNRRARGLAMTTCKFYTGKLTRFEGLAGQPLLSLDNDAVAEHLFNLPCRAGGKQALSLIHI